MHQVRTAAKTLNLRLRPSYDVAVVGAGPVGCVTAAAFAREGHSVLLLEANPKAATRFAGEWIHPPGAAVLDKLGLGPLGNASRHPACEGFAVFPDDGSDSILLPYADQARGVSCEHEKLVEELRDRVSVIPEVDYLPFARVTSIEEGSAISFTHKTRGAFRIPIAKVVGADGRASVVRDHLKLPENSSLISYMAGLDLKGVELPHEGYGHVLLGAAGPMLLYRTGPGQVRACIDLPLAHCGIRRDPKRLWDYFGHCLPTAALRQSFRKALGSKSITWAATRFRPRASYGRGKVMLVGDAVGHFHPLTATGMTIGFLDADCLVKSPSTRAYETRREAATYVSELLASALYQVIVREDSSAASLRAAIFQTWRDSDGERERTMRILAGNQTKPTQFGLAFLKVAGGALRNATSDALTNQAHPLSLPSKLWSFAPWAQWPISSIVPKPIRSASRGQSTAWDPMFGLKTKLRLPRRSDVPSEASRTAPFSQVKNQSDSFAHGGKSSRRTSLEKAALFEKLATEDLRMRILDGGVAVAASSALVTPAELGAKSALILRSGPTMAPDDAGSSRLAVLDQALGSVDDRLARLTSLLPSVEEQASLRKSGFWLRKRRADKGRARDHVTEDLASRASERVVEGKQYREVLPNSSLDSGAVEALANALLSYLHGVSKNGKSVSPLANQALGVLLQAQSKAGYFVSSWANKARGRRPDHSGDKDARSEEIFGATFCAVRCLAYCRHVYTGLKSEAVVAALDSAASWIRRSQHPHGGWMVSKRSAQRQPTGSRKPNIKKTALAVQSLLAAGVAPTDASIRGGCNFLLCDTESESSWLSHTAVTSSDAKSSCDEELDVFLDSFGAATHALLALAQAGFLAWDIIELGVWKLVDDFQLIRRSLMTSHVLSSGSPAVRVGEDAEAELYWQQADFARSVSSALAFMITFQQRAHERDDVLNYAPRSSKTRALRGPKNALGGSVKDAAGRRKVSGMEDGFGVLAQSNPEVGANAGP